MTDPSTPGSPPNGTAEAVRRIGANLDAVAWDWIAEHEGPIMFRVAARMLGASDADDACQEAFLHIRAGAPSFRPPPDGDPDAAARGWLLRIVSNTAAMWARSKRRRDARERAMTVEAEAREPSSADVEALRLALAELPESQRQPIVMHHLCGQDFETIAATLGIRSGAARMRAQAGMTRLRERLLRTGSLVGAGVAIQAMAAEPVVPAPVGRWQALRTSTAQPIFATTRIVGTGGRSGLVALRGGLLLAILLLAAWVWSRPEGAVALGAVTPPAPSAPVQVRQSPPGRLRLGICTSSEWAGDHARLYPLLHEAGARVVRYWPEQPRRALERGEWQWEDSDRLLRLADAAGIEVFASLPCLPRASGGSPRTPAQDPALWRSYVEACVTRYKGRVRSWEIQAGGGDPALYASQVAEAYAVGKRADPACRIGLGCTDVDLSFLERAIRQGAGGSFDFIAVHPFALFEVALNGHEEVFLRLGENLRRLLQRTGQRQDIELVVGEIGSRAAASPDAERRQADALVKAFTLCLVQGIDTVLWFDGRGPYPHSIVRQDWSLRPAYGALRSLTALLGPDARPIGWWNPTGRSYGFIVQGAAGPLLVTWARDPAGDVQAFPAGVVVRDASGQEQPATADGMVVLSRRPLLVSGLPEAWLAQARADAGRPFPWLGQRRDAESVSIRLGDPDIGDGLVRVGGDPSEPGQVDGVWARRFARFGEANYMQFDVDDSHVDAGDRSIEITCVVRPVDPRTGAAFNLMYESSGGSGYRLGSQFWYSSDRPGWQTVTFRLDDVSFSNNWGYNFAIRCVGSPGNLWIKDVVVRRRPALLPNDF